MHRQTYAVSYRVSCLVRMPSGDGLTGQDPRARSGLSILRVPMALEIGNQRGAEMAIGLLAAVDCHVAAKQIQRLLADADSPPVAHGAHDSGTRHRADDPLDRLIHRTRGDGFVADQPPLRTVARDSSFGLDRLTGDTVAGQSRQPQVGGARNYPLLAGRQCQVGVVLRDHMVTNQQDLTVAADRKPLDGGDPELLDAGAAEFVRRRVVRPGQPPVDLVHIAEVALQVPDERDAAVIKVSQIDAGAEDTTAAVFRMFDHPAAQYDDLREIVEQ